MIKIIKIGRGFSHILCTLQYYKVNCLVNILDYFPAASRTAPEALVSRCDPGLVSRVTSLRRLPTSRVIALVFRIIVYVNNMCFSVET